MVKKVIVLHLAAGEAEEGVSLVFAQTEELHMFRVHLAKLGPVVQDQFLQTSLTHTLLRLELLVA